MASAPNNDPLAPGLFTSTNQALLRWSTTEAIIGNPLGLLKPPPVTTEPEGQTAFTSVIGMVIQMMLCSKLDGFKVVRFDNHFLRYTD